MAREQWGRCRVASRPRGDPWAPGHSGSQGDSTPALAIEQIAINAGTGGNRLLRKRLVRQALAYGIDRQAIVGELFGKTLPKQQVLQNGFYPSSSPYYRRNWARYRYQPAEARRLLEQAGCERGTDGVYVCAGERLSLRFVTRGDVPSRVQTLGLVRGQLQKAGVEIVPEFASGAVVMNQIVAQRPVRRPVVGGVLPGSARRVRAQSDDHVSGSPSGSLLDALLPAPRPS